MAVRVVSRPAKFNQLTEFTELSVAVIDRLSSECLSLLGYPSKVGEESDRQTP